MQAKLRQQARASSSDVILWSQVLMCPAGAKGTPAPVHCDLGTIMQSLNQVGSQKAGGLSPKSAKYKVALYLCMVGRYKSYANCGGMLEECFHVFATSVFRRRCKIKV
jgi:hypothetical protein